ncbi:hypothetical protein Poly51_51730 [Rubripirellula tenax]|uniref:Uncharacterized protein n=1 Tax=Rubripirellula tenax TaxID=2528015 RepID=A0A5C6EC63_9BACT|nr:hypothetical protein [Rubripirellula tenax]TWU47373.1 hypothetical protein Poly51_51730 [Rubripirellula tenax]
MSKTEKLAIVFGVMPIDGVESVVFILENDARENAMAYAAASSSETWGEFRERCPKSLLEYLEDELASIDDQTPFSDDQIPGYHDGFWPAFPERDLADWFPHDLQKQYGVLLDTAHDGSILQFDVDHQEILVRQLIGKGYSCVRDDALIWTACGY